MHADAASLMREPVPEQKASEREYGKEQPIRHHQSALIPPVSIVAAVI
jgi:hypothetical protein